MKNGKKQKMDNEGQSQNVETDQSTGDKKILRVAESELHDKVIFECSHPNTSDYVHFRVEPTIAEHSLNGHYYKLSFDLQYIVHKHNLEKNYVLTHKKYENTLQQWLDENGNNWSTCYKRWGVNRPTGDARKIIQGILNAVHKLHKNGSFHGFLHHPENFAMDSDELVIGGHHKKIKHLSLIHANLKSGYLPGDGNLQVGMKNDIQAMSDVIFNQILRGEQAASYPPDLRHLYSLLQNATGDTNELGYIVNHPSLWHWKSRFSYIGSVYMYYQHAKSTTRREMTKELNLINVHGWKGKIRPNNPLGKIFKHDTYNAESAYQLLRYLRNAHVHYKEYKMGKYIHIDEKTEGDYLNEKYFELKTTEIGELFLVDLYDMMRYLSLEI